MANFEGHISTALLSSVKSGFLGNNFLLPRNIEGVIPSISSLISVIRGDVIQQPAPPLIPNHVAGVTVKEKMDIIFTFIKSGYQGYHEPPKQHFIGQKFGKRFRIVGM